MTPTEEAAEATHRLAEVIEQQNTLYAEHLRLMKRPKPVFGSDTPLSDAVQKLCKCIDELAHAVMMAR